MRIGKKKLKNEDTITINGKEFNLRDSAARFIEEYNITQISIKTPKNLHEWKSITFENIGKDYSWATTTSVYYTRGCSFCYKGLEEAFGCIPAIIYFK
jgi:hypothetical protein